MIDPVDHPLYFRCKIVLNASVDLTMVPKSQGRHGTLLLLVRVANQALYLGNSDSSHRLSVKYLIKGNSSLESYSHRITQLQ